MAPAPGPAALQSPTQQYHDNDEDMPFVRDEGAHLKRK